MNKKLLLVLFLSAVQLLDASAIMHEAISYVPEVGGKASFIHVTQEMTRVQRGQWASAYENYLKTGKGDPLLFDMITENTLKHGYTPLGLTAEDVNEIKIWLEPKLLTFPKLESVFSVLPSWLDEKYDNITSEIFTGINYKGYRLASDSYCQSVGEVLAPRLLEDIDGVKLYFYCKKKEKDESDEQYLIRKQFFINKQQEKVKKALAVLKDEHKYHFINYIEIDEIRSAAADVAQDESVSPAAAGSSAAVDKAEDESAGSAATDEAKAARAQAQEEDRLTRSLARFSKLNKVKDGSIKYLIILAEDLSQRMMNFFKDILAVYPDLVIVIAFKDSEPAIGNNIFIGNKIFRNLIIAGKGLRKVGNNFLRESSSLESIDLPEGITLVGYCFLYGCTELKRIILPKNLNVARTNFLQRCSSLESIDIPEGITEALNYFLAECVKLKNVRLPKKLVQVETWFLARCYDLEKIDLPEGLVQVGDNFLYACHQLNRLILPKSLSSAGINFLGYCKLERVEMYQSTFVAIKKSLPDELRYKIRIIDSGAGAMAAKA